MLRDLNKCPDDNRNSRKIYDLHKIGKGTEKKRPTDPAEIQLAIGEAIQDLVRKGLVVDSGQGRWSQKSCGSLRVSARRSTERHSQIGDRANVGCNYKLS